MNLSEFRQTYPDYNDLSDEDLTQSLHQKYYSDLSYDEFRKKFVVAQEQEPSPPTDSYLGHLGGQVQKGYLEADVTAQMGVAPALTPKQGPPVGITEGNTYPGLLPGMPTTIGTQVQAPVAPDSALAQPYEQRVKEGPYWKAAQESQRRAAEIPENPEWTDTYASKVAKGLGSVAQMGATGVALAPFVGAPLAGLAGPATMVELGAMTAGVMGGAGEQIQQGVAEGKKIEELDWPYLLGGALGTTEVAPIDLAFRFFKKYGEKNILARIGILAATGALSEGIQEGLQQVGSNLIAKHNYKPDQDIWEGVSDSFLVAMGIGGLLGGAAGAIPRAKTKGKVDVPPEDFTDGTLAEAPEFIGPPPPPEAPVEASTGPLPEIKQLSQKDMAKSNEAIEAQTAGSLPAQIDTRTYPNLTVEGAPLPYEPATVTPQVGTSATPTVGQEPVPEVGRVPPPLLTNHPVQVALQEEFGDAGSAAHFADTEGPRLGVSFHPVETRPGVWQVRMGQPKLEQVGSEYESFLDDLNNAEGEAQGASKQLLGRMRANVEKNRLAYEEQRKQEDWTEEDLAQFQNLDEKVIQAEPTEPTIPPTVQEGPKLGREARLQAIREAASKRLGANRPAVPSAEQDALLGKTKHLKFKPESVEEQKQLQEMLGKQAELLEADVQRATRDNKKISTAVLAQAVDDIQAGGDAAADAKRWLNERGKTNPFSFDSVVDTLGLDGEAIKEAIETGKADPEAMRDTIKLYSGLGWIPQSLETLQEMSKALVGKQGASLPGGGGATWLSRRAQEHIVLPQWVAKVNEKYKAFYDNASDRLAKQTADISAALEQIGIWRELSPESRTRMVDFVNQIRDKKLKATPSPEIETYTDGDLTKVRRVEKHMEEFEAYCKSKGLSDDEVNFMVGWKTGLNDAFVTRYNRLAEMRNIDPNTLSEMLNNEGFISNYFPHMWNQKSSYYTIGSKDGKTVAHVPLPVGFGQRVLGKHLLYNKFVEGLKKNPAFEGLEWSQPQSVREHERYWLNSPVPIDTMSRLLDEAAKRLEGNEELAPLAKAFRSQIPAEVAQIMKTRYQGNFAHRRGILGFETQDITKVYFDYISHTYSNLSKMEASKEYTNLMFKTKPSSEDFKLFADFVQDEMSPYGQFEKWMDGFRSLLFARYLGLRLKPAALNLTNMTTASIPMLGIYTKGAASSAKLHGESMKDIAKQWRSEFPTHRRVTGIQGAAVQNTLSPHEIRAQIDSYTDSTIQAQMMREYRGEFKDQNSLTQQAMQVLGRPMEMTEWYMRASTLNAALRAVERGLITHSETLQKYGWEQGEKVDLSVEENYQKALDFAQDIVNSSYADYTHFNKPPMIRSGKAGAALRTAYTFRLFNQHLMHMWSWMLQHEGSRGKVAFVKSMVGNALAGGAKAAPPLALLAWMYKQWDKEDPEDKLREDYPSLGRVWDVAFEGLPGLGGVYLGGSMEVGFPQTISEAIGVPAAVVTDIVNSVNAWSSGNPGKAVEYLAPLVVARDLLSAWRGATTGERTVGGRPINVPGEVEPAKLSVPEAFEKALGFRPMSTERRWRLSQGLQELNEEHREVQGKFADRYMNAIARDDQDKQAKIIDEIIAYNMIWLAKERPEMVITMDSLSDALNSRMGVRMPPVQMRGKALQRIEGYGLQPSYQE